MNIYINLIYIIFYFLFFLINGDFWDILCIMILYSSRLNHPWMMELMMKLYIIVKLWSISVGFGSIYSWLVVCFALISSPAEWKRNFRIVEVELLVPVNSTSFTIYRNIERGWTPPWGCVWYSVSFLPLFASVLTLRECVKGISRVVEQYFSTVEPLGTRDGAGCWFM